MRSILLCYILCSLGLLARAQSAAPEVMATSGSHLENGSMQMSYTIGEPITQTESNANTIATQGFHQTKLSAVGTEDLAPNVLIEVFPNPAQDHLMIASEQIWQDASIHLYDTKGALIYVNSFDGTDHTIDFSIYQPGTYFLKVSNGSQSIKTFTIQKIQ